MFGEPAALLAAIYLPVPGEQPALRRTRHWEQCGLCLAPLSLNKLQSCVRRWQAQKVVPALPGATSHKRQSRHFPRHRYLSLPPFPGPAQVFAQQGTEPGQTKVIKLVLEGMDLTLYLDQEQTPYGEKSDADSASSVCGNLEDHQD